MIWSIFQAIFLLSVILAQGNLVYDGESGGEGFSATSEASVEMFAALSTPTADPSPDALLDRVDRTTFAYVDGTPRLFPVGLNATLTSGVGDCTDLALLRTEVLRSNGIPARPVHGLMVWDVETFRTDALHMEVFGRGIAVHDWVELGDGRTMGTYEGVPGIRCIKTGNGVCLQPVFETLGYL